MRMEIQGAQSLSMDRPLCAVAYSRYVLYRLFLIGSQGVFVLGAQIHVIGQFRHHLPACPALGFVKHV